jgi:hypothetical protein
MNLQEAKLLVLQVLRHVMEEKLDEHNVQLAQVSFFLMLKTAFEDFVRFSREGVLVLTGLFNLYFPDGPIFLVETRPTNIVMNLLTCQKVTLDGGFHILTNSELKESISQMPADNNSTHPSAAGTQAAPMA